MQSELTERAKTAWNSIADEFNQWDALGLDEQETYVALTAALSDKQAAEVKDEDAWLGLSTVSDEDLQEALDLLPSVLRPSMSNRIVAAITEQASIIDRFKRTSRARRLSFEAARSALVDVQAVEPDWWLVTTEMGKVIFHGPDKDRAERVAAMRGRPVTPLYTSPSSRNALDKERG